MSLVISPILSEYTNTNETPVVPRSSSRKSPTEIAVLEKSRWSYYHRPVTVIVFGAIVFLSGILYTIFYFTKFVDVPYALGPAILSIGLIFLVTGLVWLPIVTEAIRQKGLLTKIKSRNSMVT